MKKITNALSILFAGITLSWLLGTALFNNANPLEWSKFGQKFYIAAVVFFSLFAIIEIFSKKPPGKK